MRAPLAKAEVRYPEQAARLKDVVARNPDIPEYGKLAWFTREFERRFDVSVTREGVRRWLEGLAEPRGETRAQLAEILGVDVGFMMAGTSQPSAARSAQFSGAELVVTMMLQAAGWKVRSADSRAYDLDAEIGPRRYKIEVKQARQNDDGTWAVRTPKNIADVVFLVVYIDPTKGELALAHVVAEPGVEVTIHANKDGALDATGGTATRLTDLTQPI